jgi:hypothetical protein
VIPLIEEVGRHDPPFVAGHRCQPWGAARRRIAGRIHCRVRYALQVVVDRHAVPVRGDTRRGQVEVVDLGDASGAVDDHVCLHLERGALGFGVYGE